MNITLNGKATASLKNLVPLRKEKECSAEFLTSLDGKKENYIVRTRAKVSLRLVFVEVVDVPCVRKLVALAVLEIICSRSGCLSGQVRAEPF
jgi:hypothetical protein